MKKYKSYKGMKKTRTQTVLTTLLIVALLSLLAYACYEYFQDFAVLSSSEIKFELPGFLSFLKKEPAPEPPAVVEPPPPEPAPPAPAPAAPPPEPTPEPPPERGRPEVIKGVYLQWNSLLPGETAGQIGKLAAETGLNTVLIDIKLSDGRLTYPTSTEIGVLYGVSADAMPGMAVCVEELKEAGLYVIGYASAYRDNIVPRQQKHLAVKTTGGVSWLDRDMIGWMDPYYEENQSYLAQVAAEAVDIIGFDEILFYNFGFPTLGRLEMISYGVNHGSSRYTPVGQALAHIAEAASDVSDMTPRVSVMLTAQSANSGRDNTAGQDIQALSEKAAGFFYQVSAEAAFSSGAENGAAREAGAVPIVIFGNRTASGLPEALNESGYILYRTNGAYQPSDFGSRL